MLRWSMSVTVPTSALLRADPAVSAAQEFPVAVPAELRAEATSLESLVHHAHAVEASQPLELVQRIFRERRVEFMAVTRDGRVAGLCARGQLGFIMSSRFGFALYSQQPIETVLVARPLIVETDTPVRSVLDRALSRHGDEFHEDVVLVDAARRLIGLIRVEALAQLQSRLVAEQLEELRRQHERLRRKNLALFEANHAARQSEGRYLGLFESHTLGVALLDVQGGIHEHNRRLAELLQGGDEPLTMASLAAWVTERERPVFLALLEAHARGSAAPATRELTLDLPGRGTRIFRCSTGWIRETGQICACLDDVTEQRALERSVLRQEKQSLLDTLVGGIAHELNNKLTPVQGFADLLNAEFGGRAGGYAELISRSVTEAARIIRQLLELSKPGAQVVETIDLRSLVEEALVMLKFQLREAGCELRTLLPADPVWVQVDAGQLKQVMLNLVINALHAMAGRRPALLTLEVRQVERSAQLVVADTGCGIAPENLPRIFDPFFTTKGPSRGTGLGLSICFSIVRQHGGEIAVESQLDQGTRFTVNLPVEPAVQAPLFVDVPAACGAAAATIAPGANVLVVEDEVVLRRLMQELLVTQFGCRVDVATHGAEALALAAAGDYALIVSDIRMPTMSGTEFYLRLREQRPELARRFVFVTGHPGEPHLEAEIAQWAVPVIAKPFTLARIVEVCGPFLRLPSLKTSG